VVAGGSRPRRPGIVDLGYLSDADLAALLRAAEVFVWLPLAEGFGMPVLEAAACGTPVVTTPVPAAAEHLGERCRQVSGGDVAGAVGAVQTWMAESDGGPSIDGHAVTERHSWERTADGVAEILAAVGT